MNTKILKQSTPRTSSLYRDTISLNSDKFLCTLKSIPVDHFNELNNTKPLNTLAKSHSETH